MPTRLREWLLAPVRTPARGALTVAVVALLALAGWYGMRVARFHRDLAAAREALAEYDFPEARRRLASCLALRPNDSTALLLAAQAARRDGSLDEAQEHYDRYREGIDASTPEGAIQGVLLRVTRGEVKPVVDSLLEYIEIRHPDSEQILEALARGCVNVYRLDEASFWTKQLLDRFPHNPVGRLIEAQTNETLRKRERAAELARRLVEDYPNNDKARLYLAGLLAKGHQYKEAVEQYQVLRRRQPDQIMPLLGLVRALLALGRLDEAAPLAGELEERHGDVSEALLECARFALREKRPEDAERLLRRAERLAPYDYEVHYELAVCLRQLDRTDEARRHLERSEQIQADMRRLEKAVEAMVKSPGDPEPRLEAGRICLRNGQVTEGLRWLGGALELAPNHKATHEELARHYEAEGDKAQAEHHRSRAR